MDKKKIIIDTDPGHDDAIALMLAILSKKLEILGITTVAGNVSLELTTKNALKICHLLNNKDIKVFSGAEKPLKRQLVTAEHVHGKTGLDGPYLPEPISKKNKDSAHDFIIENLERFNSKTVTICALGPLTNIAKVIIDKPNIAKKIKEIVLMGGSFFEGGNISPVSEFNIFVDPESAKIVFNSEIPITMFPLDVTHKVLANKKFINSFKRFKNPLGDVVFSLLEFFSKYDVEKYNFSGPPLHDPNVIIYLIKPNFYQGKKLNVEIETSSKLTLGMTVVDWWEVTNRKKNANFIYDVDTKSVLNLMHKILSNF